MYRVVIVDDEEPVLDSFAFILERESDDFALCGKARSGAEAVALISDVKPDLVFMDIQMPGIDGIDAITQIRAKYPEIVFILATAYERFDIAQRAIPLGVFSYMVKPISRRALVGELHRVRLHLDERSQRSKLQLQDIQVLQKTKDEVMNRFLGGLAWGSPTSEEWEVFARLFSLKSERGTIRLFDLGESLTEEARATLFQRLTEKIQFKFSCYHTTIGGQLVVFFPEDQSLERLDSSIDHVVAELVPQDIRIGKGCNCHYSQLGVSFSEAFQSLEESTSAGRPRGSQIQELQDVCAALLKSDFSKGLALFEDYWVNAFREDEFLVAKGKMVGLFTLLLAGIDRRAPEVGTMDFCPAEEIMPLPNVEAWRKWSADTLGRFQKVLQEKKSRSLPQHLSKALSIIHHKFDQPIQLSTVASECQITASYLSRLFSEHLATSFVEYLTRYRIDRATTLLREDGLSIKEASGLVGFQDPNYFSRIFRRYVGVSPSELFNRRIHNED
jgi:two-component system response regulator YesN